MQCSYRNTYFSFWTCTFLELLTPSSLKALDVKCTKNDIIDPLNQHLGMGSKQLLQQPPFG